MRLHSEFELDSGAAERRIAEHPKRSHVAGKDHFTSLAILSVELAKRDHFAQSLGVEAFRLRLGVNVFDILTERSSLAFQCLYSVDE